MMITECPPQSFETITVNVQQKGTVSDKNQRTSGSLLQQKLSYNFSKEAETPGPCETYHNRLASMTEEEIDTGNVTHCMDPGVIRKALSESQLKRHRLDEDMDREMKLVTYMMKEQDESQSPVRE